MSSTSSLNKRTETVKRLALDGGFDFCGISKAEFLEDQAEPLEAWLKAGKQGKMRYMERYFDQRLDPKLLVPGARSVITLLYNHYPPQSLPTKNNYHIARYAYGKDYHQVVKRKLKTLLEQIRREVGQIEGRVFVDSAPVMERTWAQRSGAGWIGKNSLLLTKDKGSYFFIAEIITDLELLPDGPIADFCGSCTRCIDSCPTEAITPYQVDGSKCISYFTIELRDEIPERVSGKFKDWIFGCDICQEVCPWNRFSKPHNEPEFLPVEDLLNMDKLKWQKMDETEYRRIFKGSAVKRAKYSGLKRNIEFVANKKPRVD